MKIGIVTYHKSHNYGALLQAIALKEVLQKNGHTVYFVDYFPSYHKLMYSTNPFTRINQKGIRGVIRDILKYPYRRKRYINFMSFINDYIQPYCKPLDEGYDLVIYGSDQIWRLQRDKGDFNPVYFGDGRIRAHVRASYAASMGDACLSDCQKKRIKLLASHLDYVSVREHSLKLLLEEVGVGNVYQTLDPTLLLQEEEWDRIISPLAQNRKYILFYDLMRDSFDRQAIYTFAKEKKLDVIEIRGNAMQKDTDLIRTAADPVQFISLIKGAEFVFTSSFHGLAFSIIYKKQFYASFKKNAGRADSLLNMLHLKNRLLEPNVKYIGTYDNICYDSVMIHLNEIRKESLNYLFYVCEQSRARIN